MWRGGCVRGYVGYADWAVLRLCNGGVLDGCVGLCLVAVLGCFDGCVGLMHAWWLCLRWVEDIGGFASKDGERGEWSFEGLPLVC